MLNQLSAENSHRLRTFFEEAGYTESNLRKHLGAAELPSERLRNRARLLDRTSAATQLNTLLRWFWVGDTQDAEQSAALIPDDISGLLLESGLVVAEGRVLAPRAMLLHIDGFLIASDHPVAIEKRQTEMVLWPNPTSKFLSRFAVTKPSRATLDLGTGSGVLSLAASRYSDSVIATDLNLRAVDCARFNARLNGIDNIEVLGGDCFAPVSGRKFDLILSNPPFFITPQTDYMFCDNPMDLDGLCRRLARECPAYLNEGGYMQMLCEWAQIEGQPWEERIAEWLVGTGCDAWVMKGLTQDPEEYAQHRIRETSQDTSGDAKHYAQYMTYYHRRGVEAIHDGLIVMRRRTGQNFVRIEEVPPTPSGNLGQMVLSTFAAHDLLRENDTDEKILALSPRLADHVRLEQICVAAEAQWRAETLNLRLTSGFAFHVAVQPLVAEFLVSFDGTRTMETAIRDFAVKANAPAEKVQIECISMVRKLIERGFIAGV
jgi:methylase of polypeptide subunit release factors